MTREYQFENLGPDRFQKLCQALIHSKFENSQSLPVGQPDGGRDGLTYLEGKEGFIVFQVKYVKDHLRADKHEWLEDILDKEIIKLKKLIKDGAEGYYFVSNIEGTAHPNSGLIDRFNKKMENIGIPCFSWFRDDLVNILDDNIDIKWSYPEIINGRDILGMLIGKSIQNHKIDVIKSYISDQYEIDKKVKFKQVEIDNSLFDLFIEVPILKNKAVVAERKTRRHLRRIMHLMRKIRIELPEEETSEEEDFFELETPISDRNEKLINAASFLLSQTCQLSIPRLILEGAPGQGKSTITQYVCQIHRIKLLQELSSYVTTSHDFNSISVRIPFRIDLRDLASYINGENPFGENQESWFVNASKTSLEQFLCFHIKFHAGGGEFSVDDLRVIFKKSAVLLVFDGFDEVAESTLREKLISVIIKGINRIESNSISLQVIITSRPTAFSKDIRFQEEDFPHFELGNLANAEILRYADKWMNAKSIDSRERKTVKKILTEKLGQPHLKSLAQNPMQLAIFLSLIHQQGESLPDKRTILYDDYVKKFFDRESEKSKIVREHRGLILDIHQYIAWILHTEAEYGNDGRIEATRFMEVIEFYLEKEGHDKNLLAGIFDSIKERVMVIVQRTMGLYEFEVQPLREYFCARFLYETTPVISSARAKGGSLPDRFDAISQNFYWLNVVRFFAGCFSRGQLPTLTDRIENLLEIEPVKYTSHPRLLTSMLLSDWVFAEYPRLLKTVVSIIIEGIGLRSILYPNSSYLRRRVGFSIPFNSGGKELLEKAFEILTQFPSSDYSRELINLITAYPIKEVVQVWSSHISAIKSSDLHKWFHYGRQLGVIYKLPKKDIDFFLEKTTRRLDILEVISNANCEAVILNDQKLFTEYINYILDGEIIIFPHFRRNKNLSLSLVELSLSPYTFTQIYNSDSPGSILYSLSRHNRHPLQEIQFSDYTLPEFVENEVIEYINLNTELLSTNAREWQKDLTNWKKIVEKGREVFGERIVFYSIAAYSVKFYKRKEITNFENLFYNDLDLCERASIARSKVDAFKWWESQLNNIENELDAYFALLLLNLYGGKRVISKNLEKIENHLLSISDNYFSCLLRHSRFYTISPKRNIELNKEVIDTLQNRTILYLEMRLKKDTLELVQTDKLKDYTGDDPRVLNLIAKRLVIELNNGNLEDKQILNKIKSVYAKKGVHFDHYFRRVMNRKGFTINYEVAKQIIKESSEFPRILVNLAEDVCRSKLAQMITPVKEIADREKWFQN